MKRIKFFGLLILLGLAQSSFASEFKGMSSATIMAVEGNMASGQIDTLVTKAQGEALVQCMQQTGDANKCKFVYSKITNVKGIDANYCFQVRTQVTAEALYRSAQ